MYFARKDPDDENSALVLQGHRVISTFLRSGIQMAIDFLMLQSFAFVAKSGVNAGVMSIIFSSCLIFTPIIFYFKYGQKLTLWDLLGALLIAICVVLIALGGSGSIKSDEGESKEGALN